MLLLSKNVTSNLLENEQMQDMEGAGMLTKHIVFLHRWLQMVGLKVNARERLAGSHLPT